MAKTGLIYLFTGDGKGKTSAALGTMVRGLGHGWKVGWISFYKEPAWRLSEQAFMEKVAVLFPDQVVFHLAGKGFYIQDPQYERQAQKKVAPVNSAVVVDAELPSEHQQSAQAALEMFHHWLQHQQFSLIILDEVCNAVADGLIAEAQLQTLLKKRGQTHLVLTGRNASTGIKKSADLVTEMKNLKHPFDQGKNAVKGLDF